MTSAQSQSDQPSDTAFADMQANTQPLTTGPKLAACLKDRVTPLGYQDKTYFFLSALGDIQGYDAEALIRRNGAIYYNLFAGDFAGLITDFPLTNKEDDVIGIHFGDIGGTLMRACHEVGQFDPFTPVRRNGIWRERGGILVHTGSHIYEFADGNLKGDLKSGCFRHRIIYPSTPPTPRFGERSANKAAVERLVEELDSRFGFIHGRPEAEMAAGYMLAAFYGAALEPRPHCFVSADAGTGKSTFLDLVQSLLGGACADKIDNATGAGLMQQYSGDGRLLLYDELEREEGQESRNDGIMMLVRLAFSGEGAKTVRGSAGGKAMNFNFSCPVMGVGILPPMIKQQDWSRFVYLSLGPRQGKKEKDLQDMLDWALHEGPDLWRLMLSRWPVFEANLASYRQAWGQAGATSRQAAVYSVPLAALDAAMDKNPSPSDWITAQVEGRSWLLDLFASQNEDTEAMGCLTYLLTKPLKTNWRSGTQLSVAQALDRREDDGYMEDMQGIGLRYNYRNARNNLGEGLIVANSHVGLRELFSGTRWQDRGWSHVLSRLPGAQKIPKPIKIGGVAQRGILLPKDVIDPILGNGGADTPIDEAVPNL